MSKKGAKIPVQALRVFLLKASVKKFSDALRDDIEFNEFTLKPSHGLTGRLYLRKAQSRTSGWVKFLQDGVAAALPKLESVPNAAALFLEVGARKFALVFGMGRYMLKDTAYEADFGILSALNAVDPGGLRSTDTFQFEAVGVHKRTQTSRSTSLADFEIDPAREHFRSVTGNAREKELANRISGTEGGVATNVRVKFAGLANHCEALLKAYKSKEYQTRFPRYDDLSRVSDKLKLSQLESKLLSRLRNGKLDGICLSPPEPLEYDDFSGFSLTPKGDTYDELDLAAYLSTLDDLASLEIEVLKRHRVFLRKETIDTPLARWTIYKSLICELKEGKSIYVLMNGEWYRLAATFAEQVRQYVETIDEVDVGLPPAAATKTEPDYLGLVAKSGGGLIVLDRKSAWCEEAGHGMEVCDVLTKDRDFVHVKRKAGGSADLSHMFLQGRNSALALLRDARFREEAREHLKPFGTTAVARIPKDRPNPTSMRVVYGVMGKVTGTVVSALPFFSQLSLKCVTEELAERGIRVGLAKIETS